MGSKMVYSIPELVPSARTFNLSLGFSHHIAWGAAGERISPAREFEDFAF
jgi:hypothetical protein